ncbi:hypothetical protein [Aureimonas phyllosphaerae]|uniref:Uncharacterized protein n=1 Tax=Aureimonas phyllosphaerae TaxID=1166078 RepID=A0A7W6BW63_9HYPH|nr:hypothetical protein [Aureimonas phyllosphaerae]MBB3938032.1 hypothetical protein [Aureimonas phyllosphaerae]MBB3962039.1 hypothetical protein [Aureimonas phyllosphaerae]
MAIRNPSVPEYGGVATGADARSAVQPTTAWMIEGRRLTAFLLPPATVSQAVAA